MTDSCDQEHERNSNVSTSDDDSISLLPNACESRGTAEDMEISNLAPPQDGNKEKKNKVEINRLKPPYPRTDPGISCFTQSAAHRADSASQSGNCKSDA